MHAENGESSLSSAIDADGKLIRVTNQPSDLPKELKPLWQLAVDGFMLEPDSLHGPRHWRSVYFNAIELAAASGGDPLVVRLFAILHDCRRMNEHSDPDHGQRAADLITSLRGNLIDLDDFRFEQLTTACIHHDRGKVSDDPTIGSCWDADRLDLPRVGIYPIPRLMSTQLGKQRAAKRG